MEVSEEGTRIKVTWKIGDPTDIESARDFFMKLTRQGWLAATREEQARYRRVLDFNPECGELWFVPISEGG